MDIRPSTSEVTTTNQRITMTPSVLLNVLKEFNFVGAPLWRLSDRKDLVRVELTFHKNQQDTTRGRPKAGGSLQSLLASGLASPQLLEDLRRPDRRLLADSRLLRRRHHHQPSRLQTTTPSTIRHQYKPQTAEITPSPIIMRPITPPPSPEASKDAKDQVTEDYKTAEGILLCRHRGRIPSAWEVWCPGHLRHHSQGHRESIKTAQRTRGNQYRSSCLLRLSAREQALATSQRATSKFYDDPWYTTKEMLIEANSVQQKNTAYWYDVLEESCRDPLGDGGGPSLLRHDLL